VGKEVGVGVKTTAEVGEGVLVNVGIDVGVGGEEIIVIFSFFSLRLVWVFKLFCRKPRYKPKPIKNPAKTIAKGILFSLRKDIKVL
jgi:hypothetical protein